MKEEDSFPVALCFLELDEASFSLIGFVKLDCVLVLKRLGLSKQALMVNCLKIAGRE
jgi:hypothetical protein